ncbi:MAG TPA: PilZ domain-containing protein [Candidatus Binatus sp.]|nr:PilZ domain-containing protein [Candidatus Binatus sp.]
MATASMRRTDRVSLTVLLEASGTDSNGQEFKEPTRTLLINRGGAVIILERDLKPEQQIQIRRQAGADSQKTVPARIVGEFGRQKDGHLYGIEILDNENDFWKIEFPSIAESTEAVARMLLHCSYCKSREVAYLNELELRGFETNRGIARHCKTCGVPSIWTQAPHEDEKQRSLRAARGKGAREADQIPGGEEQRARQRMRMKTRLTACIRQPDSDDELAVCEDISPIGMCFRSKRRYDTQALIQVAVPYSPDAANIFLPANVVYSEEIPRAGLFRHGVEYRRVGPRAR